MEHNSSSISLQGQEIPIHLEPELNYIQSKYDQLFLGYQDDDALGTMQDLTESRDLEFEYHHVTTEDGYILELHRIYQNVENQDSNSTTKPVFFM